MPMSGTGQMTGSGGHHLPSEEQGADSLDLQDWFDTGHSPEEEEARSWEIMGNVTLSRQGPSSN